MITSKELEKMRNMDVKDVNIDDLVDIRDVKIDTSKPQIERMLDFIEQLKNPYFFKYENYIVKIKFSDDSSDSFQTRLEKMFKSIIDLND